MTLREHWAERHRVPIRTEKKEDVNTGRWRRDTQRARNLRRISEVGGQSEQ